MSVFTCVAIADRLADSDRDIYRKELNNLQELINSVDVSWFNLLEYNKNILMQCSSMEKERVLFPPKKQSEFIKDAKNLSKTSWRKQGEFFGISYNTIRTYFRESTRISYSDFNKICKKLSLNPNETMNKYGAKKVVWSPELSFKDAIYLGQGRTVLNGPEIKFKNMPEKLKPGKIEFSRYDLERNIRLPTEINSLLAEEVGIHLGDGYLSEKSYGFRIKGDKKEEKEYYLNFIRTLYKKIYNVNLNIKDYKTSYGFELSSKAIWGFKTRILGIRPGGKDNIAIPKKFKVNDIEILCALVRGFFDTDGCVHFSQKNRSEPYYPTISVASISRKLILDYFEILNMLGFNPKKYKRKGRYYSIVLYGYANFRKYRELIGWNNPKHLRKVKEWSERNSEIAKNYMATMV